MKQNELSEAEEWKYILRQIGFGAALGAAFLTIVYLPQVNAGGEWHCPFPPEWVKKMRHAAKVCEQLTAEDIEAFDRGNVNYRLPPWDILEEPQDARGLPESWCKKEAERFSRRKGSCIDTYDYFSIPEIVITDGYDDWPFHPRRKVLQA